MRRLTLFSAVIAFLVVACSTVPTAVALPQAPPAAVPDGEIRWVFGLLNAKGDTARVFGRLALDSVIQPVPIPVIVRLTDTLYCSAGVCSRTKPVATTVDTVVRPVLGIPIGAWNYPLDSLGKGGAYNGTELAAQPARLLADLAKVRAAKATVVLAFLREKTKDATGRLSVAASKAYLDTWPDISMFIADGTVAAINVTDDVNAATWVEDPPRIRLDSLAKLVKDRWPIATTTVRNRPDQSRLPGGQKYRWLDAAWAQYNSPFRDGPPEAYAARQKAIADSLGLGLVIWFNALSGGCGPANIQAKVVPDRRCLPDAPGVGIYGTYADTTVRRYQMSAAEVLRYGKTFLPYTCLALHWTWSPGYNNSKLAPLQLSLLHAFDGRADVRAAMVALRAIADATPRKSCKVR